MLLKKEIKLEDSDEPWNDRELLWHLYRERDWSQRTIAYELGVDKGKVLKGLIENDVLQPWKSEELLVEALEKHETPSAIAESWNCSEVTIYRWLDEHGIKRRAELTPELLHELYHEQQLTVDEIAEDLGYAPVEVYFTIEEYEIERREGTHRYR